MFERFTERARQVVVLAQEEARTMKHGYIGTEHLLLGLLREEQGLAAQVLEALDVELGPARAQIVRIVGSGDKEDSGGQIPFTPRARKVLELALREARALGQSQVRTEHVLLGLVREDSGVASRVLLEFDADAERVRASVSEFLGRGVAATPPAGRPTRRWFRPMRRDAERRAREEGREPDGGDLLLSITRDADGVAASALAALGVDRQRLREAVARARRPLD